MTVARIKHEIVPGNDSGFAIVELDDYPHEYELHESDPAYVAPKTKPPAPAPAKTATPTTPVAAEPPAPAPVDPAVQAGTGWAKPEGQQ